jgi:hypothetical protein
MNLRSTLVSRSPAVSYLCLVRMRKTQCMPILVVLFMPSLSGPTEMAQTASFAMGSIDPQTLFREPSLSVGEICIEKRKGEY